jgi:hypothetical protein
MTERDRRGHETASAAVDAIAGRILLVRGTRVLLDADLAALYGVETRVLVQAVKRNAARFPEDFLLQLTAEEFAGLRSQFVISNAGRGGRRYPPQVFTEHGALMAATILNSSRAIEVSVYVVRAFVQLRGVLASNKELAQRLRQLEQRLERRLTDHDVAIADILRAIRQLMNPPEPAKRPIGFVTLSERKPR